MARLLPAEEGRMAELDQNASLMAARIAGASAGAAVSLIYMVPKGRREAVSRFLTGLACGLVFAGPAGLWIAARLGLEAGLSDTERLLTGASAASLCAWWGLGILARLGERLGKARR